jgi:hypothetical protein
VITPTRLFLASLTPEGNAFETKEYTNLLITDAKSAAAKMTSIASGDYDGDGVEDIAVADSGSVRILRQLPRIR